jgi:tRNA (guanine37-N1)-methyltransferase
VRFTVVTIFPEFFDSPLAAGLLGKAVESGRIEIERVTPRAHAADRHQTVDDKPYGGGPGLVMKVEPLAKTLAAIKRPGRMLLLSPRGRPLTQALARELSAEPALTIVCGRYEGIDERLLSLFPLELVSVGDFVLNGGEAAALCLIESVARLLPEFMHAEESLAEESFASGLLEYPHYTRPEVFEGLAVPEVLLSGAHARIAAWRREQSLTATARLRPGLLAEAGLAAADCPTLRAHLPARLGRGLYLALVHHPVLNKSGDTVAVSLTNLDLHDMARVSRTYDLGGAYAVTPLADQRRLAETLIAHWVDGPAGASNPDRASALRRVRVAASLDEVLRDVEALAGQPPAVVATSARFEAGDARCALTCGQVRAMLELKPVLLVFGTGSGLAGEVLERAGGRLRPVRFLDGYNHLSVRAALAVVVDRLLGDVH